MNRWPWLEQTVTNWSLGPWGTWVRSINYNRFGFGSVVKFGDALDGQAYIHMLRSCRSLEMQMRRR